MWFLIALALFLAWLQREHINELRKEIELLRSQVLWLMSFAHKKEVDTSKEEPKSEPVYPSIYTKELAGKFDQIEQTKTVFETVAHSQQKTRINFEQQFGARLPVWIGGIALALAGFYMVRYSIEVGLLSPTVRLVLGVIFGVGLLVAANWIRNKGDINNVKRIAQALSGAGLADLYVCLFAATNLYHLIPPIMGFALMAIVTTIAVILSLRHGAPIALLGLIGGFLTPALVGSTEPNTPLLFIYLYVVLTGLFVVIRRHNWWLLGILTIVGAFLWVGLWMVSSFSLGDGIWMELFLLAVSATVVMQSKQVNKSSNTDVTDTFKLSSVLNYLTLGGASILMAIVVAKSDFGLIEWGMYGLLAVGSMVLAYFKPKIYGFVPWVSMAINAVMLFIWDITVPSTFAITTFVFAMLYCTGGYYLFWRSRYSTLWGGLASATSLSYYLLAYYRLHFNLMAYRTESWITNLPIWGMLALLLFLISMLLTKEILDRFEGDKARKERLLAIFAVTATTFLSVGLTIELKREFLSVAFAAQVLVISWINNRVDIKALRYIAGILLCVFGFLLIPQILLLAQLTAYSLIEAQSHLQDSVPIVSWPIFQLGLPALMFAGSSVLLRMQKEDQFVRSLEIVAVMLIGIMGYYLTRHAFHIDENVLFVKAKFIERSVITNIFFVYGLGCLWMGRRFERSAISLSGLVLVGVALFRIGYFDLLIYNPFWSHQLVGALPLFNGLLLSYGLPILWLMQANKELHALGKSNYVVYTSTALLILVFVLVSLNVRQFFHGEYLDTNTISNAEIYTYSVVWLLLGVILLIFGTVRKNKMIRIASLSVMVLTIGKVFLYDASELTGLYRVFSFLGLGLSLMILSWFYTRFVFGARQMLAKDEK